MIQGVLPFSSGAAVRHYDTLDAMLMALQSGELDGMKVPYYTAKYLCAVNDGLTIRDGYHPEKAAGVSEFALSLAG